MYNVVIFIEDQLRGKIVRLQVDLDRRVEALIEWYVAHFGLPRRYFDQVQIEYRLLRAVDKRALAGKKTLREAGIAKGELLQLHSRKGRLVWRTVEAMLDEIEGEIKGRIVDEPWDRVTEKLAQIEATETGGWYQWSIDLSAFAGQEITFELRVTTDRSELSNLFVDDFGFGPGASARSLALESPTQRVKPPIQGKRLDEP